MEKTDLNGFQTGGITFVPVRESDLQLIYSWLSDPYLVQIWLNGRPVTYKDVENKYLPRIHGGEPTHPYLISYNGKPIGYIQSYMWKDYPESARYFEPWEREASGLDVFIGAGSYRGKGLGPFILRRFLKDVIFTRHNADVCLITPLANNRIAIRAYEKAGFRYVRMLDHPDEPSTVCIMSIHKGDVTGDVPPG